jgi:hypothetical protein
MPESQPERLPTVLEVLAEWKSQPPPLPQIPHSPKKAKSQPHLWLRTEIYSSHREKHFRFRWGQGKETFGYLHINGGAASTNLVQSRKRQVDEAIASGADLKTIFDLIRQWQSAPVGRKPF